MNKTIRSLLAAGSMLVPLASFAMVPAAQASTTPALHGGALSPNYPSDCVDQTVPAVKWSVNATGIHIKSGPNGTNRDAISESATFISNTLYGSVYVVCYAPADGQYWVYGQSQAHPNEYGWIGCDYLNVLHSSETCTTALGRP